MKCHWTIRENVWKPPVRIGSTITNCNGRPYLFGGYNTQSMNDIQYLDPQTAKWVQIPVTRGQRPLERYGHTALFNKGNLYIFGGEQKYNVEIGMRETLNDLWTYNIQKNEFSLLSSGNKFAC